MFYILGGKYKLLVGLVLILAKDAFDFKRHRGWIGLIYLTMSNECIL